MKRMDAIVVWKGNGIEGEGKISTKSEVLKEAFYNYKSRTRNGEGTNPEELIAAAHAGCFTMKLAFNLQEAGFTPEELETSCAITFSNGVISASRLEVNAKIARITDEQFQQLVKDAEQNCPVSKVLNLEITTKAVLI
ncbi:OsmC family peroxiredoxin [Bacteroidales bacterium OttesenSCG-928-C19]|nr:OsmC family peroxiredoxin [Bacteroidales bacterium OttesenSCG-928-C19]